MRVSFRTCCDPFEDETPVGRVGIEAYCRRIAQIEITVAADAEWSHIDYMGSAKFAPVKRNRSIAARASVMQAGAVSGAVGDDRDSPQGAEIRLPILCQTDGAKLDTVPEPLSMVDAGGQDPPQLAA